MTNTFHVHRDFTFCYAHRLPQHRGKCRFLHGHNGRIRVTLSTNVLNEDGMVVDFGRLKEVVGNWIDENWDHRTILSQDDSLIPLLEQAGQPLFIVPFFPTAERLSQYLLEVIREKGFPVSRVDFWETSQCCAGATF